VVQKLQTRETMDAVAFMKRIPVLGE